MDGIIDIGASAYEQKSQEYFSGARRQIEPLLPKFSERVLEVGCGSGGTIRWLKQNHRVGKSWGIELFEPAGRLAQPSMDHLQIGNAEELIATVWPAQQFDLVLCLDVLEHMTDPWRFVEQLAQRVAPSGQLIASIPNVRCLHTLIPLLLRGEWTYTDEGLLDRTHLRFFTRKTALDLLCVNGLQLQECLGFVRPGTKLETLDRLTFGKLRGLTTWQYLIRVSRP
jgi:2-polyprenyl-3-methyl-5-hydroxy-6-metoxy-1,4-benzoquinol methylase